MQERRIDTIQPLHDLSATVSCMTSDDYKERFLAEYIQTKIRYERLKDLCDRIEASFITCGRIPEPVHTCHLGLLRQQQRAMGEYLHVLELRGIIEGIDCAMQFTFSAPD